MTPNRRKTLESFMVAYFKWMKVTLNSYDLGRLPKSQAFELYIKYTQKVSQRENVFDVQCSETVTVLKRLKMHPSY